MRAPALRRAPWYLRRCGRGVKVESEVRSAFEVGRRVGKAEAAREHADDLELWFKIGQRVGAGDEGLQEALRRLAEQLGDDE